MRGAKSDSPVSTWLHSLTLTAFAVLCALGVKTNRACNRAGRRGGDTDSSAGPPSQHNDLFAFCCIFFNKLKIDRFKSASRWFAVKY